MTRVRRLLADTILFTTDWLSIRETDSKDYTYVHENKAVGGRKVCVLPYYVHDDGGVFFYTIKERCTPQIVDPIVCAITGKCDTDTPIKDALRELEEEAGFVVDEDDLIYLGRFFPSKSMDTEFHAFAVDLTGTEYARVPIEGDGTKEEEALELVLLNEAEVYESTDPLLAAMVYKVLWLVD